MKKNKEKNTKTKKTDRKPVEASLKLRLIEMIESLGLDPKKAKAEIEKAAKQLAKKLSKGSGKKQGALHKIIKPKVGQESQPGEFDLHDRETDDKPDQNSVDSWMIGDESAKQVTHKRTVNGASRNMNVDPVALAENMARERVKEGAPNPDQQLGSVS